MADPTRKKSVHVSMIIREHRNACKKHPKPFDILCEKGGWDMVAKHYKQANDSSETINGYMVLLEEVSEALEAYDKGELENCLTELAQCGAVILRMMQFVRDEIKGVKK